LLTERWERPAIERFIRAVCAAANDDEVDDRLKAIETTAERSVERREVTGWATLDSLIGSEVGQQVREWLGLGR
jgi:hypothetical protein